MIARLREAGVDPEQLERAANAAARLCADARPLAASCLEPAGYSSYQHLLARLARGDAS